ncbi:MAG: serine hydrolase, partial [Novosphingobium sp.]
AQVWLNRPQPDGTVQWPGAPVGTFSMNGHLGQYVVVNRDNATVVVRLGKTADGQHLPVREGVARLLTLYRKGPEA